MIVYTVSNYLDRLNVVLGEERAKIRGEISRIEEREKTIYFDLKDSQGEPGVLNCLIYRSQYLMMGIDFKEGMEVIALGQPNIWKPSGRLSVKVESVELVGEGALKKAYDALKKKLASEGLFSEKRKRKIPSFAYKIGLITSRYGAAIGDFTTNLENIGFKIKFLDCRVEGQEAVPDLIRAIEWFNKNSDCQVLVITRGGGSWESLQAFNNEAVSRAVANSKIPVLCGVGHERDVPIVALVADKSVSTPTAAAQFLSYPWREARQYMYRLEERMVGAFEGRLYNIESGLDLQAQKIKSQFTFIYNKFPILVQRFKNAFENLRQSIGKKEEEISNLGKKTKEKFWAVIEDVEGRIRYFTEKLEDKNPRRQLRLGYSLIFAGEKLIKDAGQLSVGQFVRLQFHKGEADSKIKKIER